MAKVLSGKIYIATINTMAGVLLGIDKLTLKFSKKLIFDFAFSSSNNDDDIDNSLHSHTAPPFLMGAESKLFSTPGSFNFSMAALAADSAALAGML